MFKCQIYLCLCPRMKQLGLYDRNGTVHLISLFTSIAASLPLKRLHCHRRLPWFCRQSHGPRAAPSRPTPLPNQTTTFKFQNSLSSGSGASQPTSMTNETSTFIYITATTRFKQRTPSLPCPPRLGRLLLVLQAVVEVQPSGARNRRLKVPPHGEDILHPRQRYHRTARSTSSTLDNGNNHAGKPAPPPPVSKNGEVNIVVPIRSKMGERRRGINTA